jgi:ADP-ribose pyrophosphatase YjhB (NUDIX family)
MTEENIAWAAPTGSFKLRSAAMIRDGEDILLCKVDDLEGWFLPGGKVQFGESSSSALARELVEEIGVACTADGPALIVECVLEDEEVVHQEVCFYYEVEWPAGVPRSAVRSNAADQHRFAWVPAGELPAMNFMPMEIAGEIANARSGLRHLFFDRRTTRAEKADVS